jgi:hypothetical protein
VKALYFSGQFGVSAGTLEDYGACDISLASDLPFFLDPFLLFHSERPEYQTLHDEIIRYILFLRDQAQGLLSPPEIANWYRFKEVKQNWLGFTYLGNQGSGLGADFAQSLHGALRGSMRAFGQETVTAGSHLEKLALIPGRVGRDSISDLTTNLIKGYLLEYTEAFAREHLPAGSCEEFRVARAVFNYTTMAWETRPYYLPSLDRDFVLLTPLDMLTRDDTWINYTDMVHSFHRLPEALPDAQLRAQVNLYFASRLGEDPTSKNRENAAKAVFQRFPELLDYYILGKENDGDAALSRSARRRRETNDLLIELVKAMLGELSQRTSFLNMPATSFDECLEKTLAFKQYIENQDGYRLLNPANSTMKPRNEADVQLFFGLLMSASPYDVNREANNGRGPVDFAVSKGRFDKSLIEVKLASNSHLKRNLQRQVAIYEAAHQVKRSVKMVVCYTAQESQHVQTILDELRLTGEESIVVIDARHDNKPSASTA